MGTRSLTVFKGQTGEEICVLYRQFDGYPDGHGYELARFLEPITIVNGFGPESNRKIANGMPCLAAQVVAHFKKEVGGFYLHPAGTRDVWEEFIYIVSGKEGEPPMIEILGTRHKGEPKRLFYGDAPSVVAWIEAQRRSEIAEDEAES